MGDNNTDRPGGYEGRKETKMLDYKYTVTSDETEATAYYYKLWKCLKKALADEERLGCHCNDIIVHLGKSVESGFQYYDPMHDVWCDYFLSTYTNP